MEDVRVLARDADLVRLVARPLPSPDALHDFLAAFHDAAQSAARPAEGAWIPEETAALGALAAVNTELVQRAVSQTSAQRATMDLDATIIESHKQDAGRDRSRPGSSIPPRPWSTSPAISCAIATTTRSISGSSCSTPRIRTPF